MSDSPKERAPQTKPAFTGGPPPPPKKTTGGTQDQPSEEPNIDISDPVLLRDLAIALGRKPFEIIADVMELGQFKNVQDTVAFEIASKISQKYGFHAKRA